MRSEIVTKEHEEDTMESLYSGKKTEQGEIETSIKSMMGTLHEIIIIDICYL